MTKLESYPKKKIGCTSRIPVTVARYHPKKVPQKVIDFSPWKFVPHTVQ
jgi:hypothetical protein